MLKKNKKKNNQIKRKIKTKNRIRTVETKAR
jgi:hypothetical protein